MPGKCWVCGNKSDRVSGWVVLIDNWPPSANVNQNDALKLSMKVPQVTDTDD